MPLYQYSCPECEVVLEELRSIARADDPVECPICHGLCPRETLPSFSIGSGQVAAPALREQIAISAQNSCGPACGCHGPRRSR
jgi:putative FmdB family regulatory protein